MQTTGLKALSINLFGQSVYQFVAILGTVFTMLLKLYDIISHQPVAGCER